MTFHGHRPADALHERKWEFIWWGFGKRARAQRGFEVTAPIARRWRLGPVEIRIYEDVRKRPHHDGYSDGPEENPIRRLPGP